jgi:uncharacterized protein involved in response to NO
MTLESAMANTWTANTSSPRKRASLDALFSYGFRPFFLGASVYAALIMAVWIAWLGSQFVLDTPWVLPIAGSPFAWHAHEMIFGFAVAAIAGFLLTAIPNWTGALPLSGLPLVVLVLTWLAGRIVMAISGLLTPAIVAIVDLAFLPLLGGFATVQLFVRPAPRNLLFLVIIAAFTIANGNYHLASSGLIAYDGTGTMRFALMLVVLMVAIIGGRIIPAFTHNWLHLNLGAVPMPKRIAWLDAASIISIALLAALPIVPVPGAIEGLTALAAALLNGARLLLWRGWTTWRAPIVWVLHLGYAWLVLGLFLTVLASVTTRVPSAAAIHALGAGAVGTMILAVMSRASLGHTGRQLIAPLPIVGAYVLVTLAAALRVAGSLAGAQLYMALLVCAGLAWIASFAVFALVYAPILTTPRVHTKVEPRSLK